MAQIKAREYNYLCSALNSDLLLSFYMCAIVRRFNLEDVHEFLLLVEFSQYYFFSQVEGDTGLMEMLSRELEELHLLHSVQALHLWAIATFYQHSLQGYVDYLGTDEEEDDERKQKLRDRRRKIDRVVEIFDARKEALLRLYQLFVEDQVGTDQILFM